MAAFGDSDGLFSDASMVPQSFKIQREFLGILYCIS